MQEKMFRMMERELDDIDEAEGWKYSTEEDGEGGTEPDDPEYL